MHSLYLDPPSVSFPHFGGHLWSEMRQCYHFLCHHFLFVAFPELALPSVWWVFTPGSIKEGEAGNKESFFSPFQLLSSLFPASKTNSTPSFLLYSLFSTVSVSVKLVSTGDLWPCGWGLPSPAGLVQLPVEYIKDSQRSAFLNSDLSEPQYLILITLNLHCTVWGCCN